MLGTLYREARTVTNMATMPVSVVADLATMGGELTDRGESYTESKARRITRDGKRLVEDIAG